MQLRVNLSTREAPRESSPRVHVDNYIAAKKLSSHTRHCCRYLQLKGTFLCLMEYATILEIKIAHFSMSVLTMAEPFLCKSRAQGCLFG